MRIQTPEELEAIRERAEGVEAEVLFCDANGIPLKRWSKKPSYLDVLSLLEHIRVTEREVAIWRDVASDATHTDSTQGRSLQRFEARVRERWAKAEAARELEATP